MDRDEAGLAREWPAAAGLCTIAADIAAAGGRQRILDAVEALEGGLQFLVNSAGVGEGAPVAATEDELWRRVVEVNLTAAFQLTRDLLPALRRGRGTLVQIASLAGLAPSPGMGAYGAAKAGLIQFTRVVAHEEGRHGVRANAICPGWVETPMLESYLQQSRSPEARRRSLIAMTPLGRLAQPEDVAALALFLIRPEAAFISGAAIPLDGGAGCR